MKKWMAIGIILVLGVGGYLLWFWEQGGSSLVLVDEVQRENQQAVVTAPDETTLPEIAQDSFWYAPVENAQARVTKKPFGIYITRNNSPVQPERFSGYHTGTDFEVLPADGEKVEFFAVCSGNIVQKRTVSGYGGLLVERCVDESGQTYMAVYGHVRLTSISHSVGDAVRVGETLGVLGKGYSSETDGERPHLHLGLYKGEDLSVLGYVQDQRILKNWQDICQFVC